jgi:hypothetical protein
LQKDTAITHHVPRLLDDAHNVVHPLAVGSGELDQPLDLGIRECEAHLLDLDRLTKEATGTYVDKDVILAVPLLSDNLVGGAHKPGVGLQHVHLLEREVRLEHGVGAEEV